MLKDKNLEKLFLELGFQLDSKNELLENLIIIGFDKVSEEEENLFLDISYKIEDIGLEDIVYEDEKISKILMDFGIDVQNKNGVAIFFSCSNGFEIGYGLNNEDEDAEWDSLSNDIMKSVLKELINRN